MKVSLNTIKQFTDVDLSLDELTAKINSQLGAIEEIIDLGDKYKDAVIVRIVKCEKHPNADKLSVCWVDDNGAKEDVERDENGFMQVVCGAPNVHEDMYAIWLPPRSVVPSTYEDETPFVLGARELRGIVSQGMLAAGDELALNSNHDGITEVTQRDLKDSAILKAGANFAQTFGLNDIIIDIENKMFTHRPDLFGQLGVAREIAGIQGKQFTSPDWYVSVPEFANADGLELQVFNNAPDNVPRFMAVALKNIEVQQSPLWLQCALVAMGSKSINTIVDITNYVMLLTAQPTHAYDYDKIRGHTIGARMAKAGETIKLLNDKTYELTDSDIVIADGEGPIGLAGIMGGGESDIDENTKNIILEVANFDMYTLRKSSMRHGVFTDALTRFNKGQSPLQNDYIMDFLLKSISDVSSAEQASEVYDLGIVMSLEAVRVTDEFINRRLGVALQNSEIRSLLENVELHVDSSDDHDRYLEVFPPFWRTDIELAEDIVEEVGRLYGFDRLPRELPLRSVKATAQNPMRQTKQHIREVLSSRGANEVLTYSFVHRKLLERAQQDPDTAFKLSNALSPDLQYYRLSLLPSLLAHVRPNSKAKYDDFALFELGKVHSVDLIGEDGLPQASDRLAFVVTKKSDKESSYYLAKRYLEELLRKLGIDSVRFETIVQDENDSAATVFAPGRAATVYSGDVLLGRIGELKSTVRSAFKLPDFTAGFEISLAPLLSLTPTRTYRPLSRFPSVTQDLTLAANDTITAEQALGAATTYLATLGDEWAYDVEIVSIYKKDETQKTISLRVTLSNHLRSLTASEVATILDAIHI